MTVCDNARTRHDSPPSNPFIFAILPTYRANLARDVADMKEAATKEDKLQIYTFVSKQTKE